MRKSVKEFAEKHELDKFFLYGFGSHPVSYTHLDVYKRQAFCNYKGKRHAMLLKRRKAEFALLYIP